MGLDMYLIKKKREDKREDLWEFPYGTELIYWRKANAIHRFLCDSGREIEQEVAYEISRTNLEDLLDKCNEILNVVKTKKGTIQNGQRYVNGKWEPILEEGIEIINQEEVAEILPTCSGFFFGSTDYNQWYLEDIKRTKEELESVMKDIDWNNDEVYYLASW